MERWGFTKKINLSLLGFLVLVLLFGCGGAPDKPEKLGISIPDIPRIIDGGGNIRSTIQHLQSFRNRTTWENQNEAALWAHRELEKIGLEVNVHSYEWNGKTGPNVVARINGKNRSEEIIMAIAHIDSKSGDLEGMAPGADDDASGVAVLIEAARILKETHLQKAVMFCIFSNEENGCIGSRMFALKAKNDGLRIEAVINLDILGYNRPRIPFYLGAVLAQNNYREKFKVLIKMVLNYILGMMEGKDSLKVAGRAEDKKLVALASQVVRESSGLRVREIVSDDCG